MIFSVVEPVKILGCAWIILVGGMAAENASCIVLASCLSVNSVLWVLLCALWLVVGCWGHIVDMLGRTC